MIIFTFNFYSDTRDCYYFESNISLVFLIKKLLIKRMQHCFVVFQTWRNDLVCASWVYFSVYPYFIGTITAKKPLSKVEVLEYKGKGRVSLFFIITLLFNGLFVFIGCVPIMTFVLNVFLVFVMYVNVSCVEMQCVPIWILNYEQIKLLRKRLLIDFKQDYYCGYKMLRFGTIYFSYEHTIEKFE